MSKGNNTSKDKRLIVGILSLSIGVGALTFNCLRAKQNEGEFEDEPNVGGVDTIGEEWFTHHETWDTTPAQSGDGSYSADTQPWLGGERTYEEIKEGDQEYAPAVGGSSRGDKVGNTNKDVTPEEETEAEVEYEKTNPIEPIENRPSTDELSRGDGAGFVIGNEFANDTEAKTEAVKNEQARPVINGGSRRGSNVGAEESEIESE